LEVLCDDPAPCSATQDVVVASRSHRPVGSPIGNVLRMAKPGTGMMQFDWITWPLDPRAYVVLQADDKTLITDTEIGNQAVAGQADGLETLEITEPAGNLLFFEVYGRDVCDGSAYVP
ncbi:hypothetical protein ACFLU6_12680, partial [Acidobacteriota bacterium]